MRGRMSYVPADTRYQTMTYNRCGRSGLKLPAVTLGLWQNFGHERPFEASRTIVRRAFDLGVTHFDLANNYGPPYGSAEEVFGEVLRKDLLASLDQSLRRMGLDYVDIFYSHRLDPETPLEETMGALATAVQQGKALYAGISSYSAAKTSEGAAILRDLGVPLLIHQPSYSMFNRWIEPELLDVLGEEGIGCIAFSPLAQGLLTDRYLGGVPEGSRASRPGSLSADQLSEQTMAKVRALNEIASRRGQTLAQLAIAWVLRDARVTSALIGASSVEQLEQNAASLDKPSLTAEELAEIDRYATEGDINLWAASSRDP